MRRSLHRSAVLLLAAAAWTAGPGAAGSGTTPEALSEPAATTLPAWTPGTLDIHQISTGRGNAALVVFPDGTTLLIDAGDAGDRAPEATPVPDGSRRPGEWVARYVRHALAAAGREPVLDFALLTHFHSDHMGLAGPGSPRSPEGGYGLAGITDVAEQVPIRTLIDRGWPDYAYPAPWTGPAAEEYRRFLAWQREHRGLAVERARAGAADQVRPLRDGGFPGREAGFEARIVAVDGEVWTGEGSDARPHFPPLAGLAEGDRPNENMCSIALRLRYGRFDYYTGGDLPGVPDDGAPAWFDVETPIARALGPTDVVVVDHHGSIDPANPFFLATLHPRVLIVPAWSPTHPAPVVVKRLLNERIYAGPRDLFATFLREATRLTIGPRAERFAADHGHLVVRVEPGGERYRVWVLDDRSEGYRVLSVHGLYDSF